VIDNSGRSPTPSARCASTRSDEESSPLVRAGA
jgi:hypothetical protein